MSSLASIEPDKRGFFHVNFWEEHPHEEGVPPDGFATTEVGAPLSVAITLAEGFNPTRIAVWWPCIYCSGTGEDAEGEGCCECDGGLMHRWLEDVLALEDSVAHIHLRAQRSANDVSECVTHASQPSPDLFELISESVSEARAEGPGYWHTCSGCHESEDGYDVGHYPHSDLFGCKVGGGCSECGGLGVVWDATDYTDFGKEVSQPSPVVTESGLAATISRAMIDHDRVARTEPISFFIGSAVLSYMQGKAVTASPPPSPAAGWKDTEPDGYSTDDEGGLLEDLLDEHDHGAITELTPYWCGERRWAVVHYDEDGFADHRLFDSEDEAKQFRDSTLPPPPVSSASVEPLPELGAARQSSLEKGTGPAARTDDHADGVPAATVEIVNDPTAGRQ